MKNEKLKDIFNQAAFDEVFIRQRDNVSCAAAAFATVARLYKLEEKKDYKFFRKALNVNNGSSHSDIVRLSKEHLPVTKTGNNVYHKGIAVAYIRYKPSGEDHVVVFLAKQGKTVIYYDPADHRIYRDKTSNMRRSTTAGKKDRNWTANLPAIEDADFDFWLKHSIENPYRLKSQTFWIREKKAKKAKP